MKPVILSLLLVVAVSAAQEKQTFTGVITDDMCPLGTHTHMRMGPTDAECAKACVMSHGSTYVLFDGKSAYVLSDQKTPKSSPRRRSAWSARSTRRRRRSASSRSPPLHEMNRRILVGAFLAAVLAAHSTWVAYSQTAKPPGALKIATRPGRPAPDFRRGRERRRLCHVGRRGAGRRHVRPQSRRHPGAGEAADRPAAALRDQHASARRPRRRHLQDAAAGRGDRPPERLRQPEGSEAARTSRTRRARRSDCRG